MDVEPSLTTPPIQEVPHVELPNPTPPPQAPLPFAPTTQPLPITLASNEREIEIVTTMNHHEALTKGTTGEVFHNPGLDDQ